MATTPIPNDFKELLKSLNSGGVRYLVIGGYAVSNYGYNRPTGDLDIWVGHDRANNDPGRRVRGLLSEKQNKLASGRLKDLADLEELS